MKKPNGYDEKIINQGKNLSGGQRQRLAIARAILRDAPIIIMDEPTAALDVESEAEVMRALDGLAAGRTVLMITHRLSTVGKVDEIIVMKDGRIAEQGTYKALKQREGIFANLLKVQNADTLDHDLSISIIQTASEPPDPRYSKAHVLIEMDGRVVARRQLDKLVLTVGRMPENDVAITESQQVSRLHAKILWKNNTWVIEDAESTNKLHYKGQITEEHIFANGDRIYLAPNVALVYKQESTLPAPPIPKPLRNQAQVPPVKPFAQPPAQSDRIAYQKAMLVIEIDGRVTDAYKLEKETMTIGSLASNDISIPSSFISRHHAQIQREQGAWVIKDCRSRNGLHYNGQLVPQHIFAHGDRLYLAPKIALLYQART
jgi:ABC-type multidrug transport system ATPase subunit